MKDGQTHFWYVPILEPLKRFMLTGDGALAIFNSLMRLHSSHKLWRLWLFIMLLSTKLHLYLFITQFHKHPFGPTCPSTLSRFCTRQQITPARVCFFSCKWETSPTFFLFLIFHCPGFGDDEYAAGR